MPSERSFCGTLKGVFAFLFETMDNLLRYRNFRLYLPAANRNRPPKKAQVFFLLKVGAAIGAVFLIAWLAHRW